MWRPGRSVRLWPAPTDIELAPGERVLARAGLDGGGWALVTTQALVLAAMGVPPTMSLRRWWHEITEVVWDPAVEHLVLRWADGEPATTISLVDSADSFPQVLRERVMSTYVASQRLPVRGRRGVTVAVRQHAVDRTLFVRIVPDDGLGAIRPEVEDRVGALARDLAEQAGLVLERGRPRGSDEGDRP
jgi:hypothetical protein